MAAKYPENDQDLKNNIRLCPIDQQKPGSCRALTCYDLHMCRDYLVKYRCPEFESNGKCTRSHSLFTQHNQRILHKKLKLSAKDEKAFDIISRLIKDSEPSSRSKRSSLSNDDDRFDLSKKSITHEPVVLRKMSSDIQERLSLSLPRASLTNSNHSQNRFSSSMDFSSNSSHHPSTDQFDRQGDKKPFPMKAHSSSIYIDDEKSDHSSFTDDTDENNNTSVMSTTTPRHEKSHLSTIRGFFTGKKERRPAKSDLYHSVRNDTQLKYVFHKYFKPVELSYIFGPARRYINKHTSFQIFPSGYCRLKDMNEEKEIEDKLYRVVPRTLEIDRIQFVNDEFGFFISTSAAENILEQNQISYGIISEPYQTTLSIEVIQETKDNHPRSRSVPAKHVLSARLSNDQGKPPMASDGKFRVPVTNSSIDVICGDITQMQIDLMVCVTTSITLLRSVLSKAGSIISSEFKQKFSPRKPLILNGGMTSAQKILFINWEQEVNLSNTSKAEQSLSNLVKQCLEQAYQLNMKSICFPSIGTGQIGLDPNTVSEIMIDTTVDCLRKYKMDVLFVIYPASGNDHNQQSYLAFRTCLDNLSKQSRTSRIDASSATHIPIERSQKIPRIGNCKYISTVSESLDTTTDHRYLLGLLGRLIEEQIFDLTLVHQPFLNQKDLLIDQCLSYHVLPRIDFVKHQLILRGDYDSCLQCFANLRYRRLINKYSMLNKSGGEIELNMYVSMKIDEGFNNEKSNIRIKDNETIGYDIDLRHLKIRINDQREDFTLYMKQLNATSKILPPTWCSSSYMIQTNAIPRRLFSSLDFINTFEQTMPKTEWQILRIDAIENWPLYVRYTGKKDKDEAIAFHGCSYSSVQSIIHYGLHSYHIQPSGNSIHLTRDALSSHIRYTRRSTDGKYYMFVVRLSKKHFKQDLASLSNDDAHLALPIYLIVYQR